MDGRLFLPLFILILTGTMATADAPAKLSPVLPEVSKHLQEGFADVESNTPLMARGHAELILLDNVVRYSVNFDKVPERQRIECLTCLHSAMSEWERVLGGSIRFAPTQPNELPEVLVHFRPIVTMNKEQVAGYVNWSRTLNAQSDGSVRPRFSADLQIRVKDLEGRPMPADAMRHAAMHELGHVLGLDDSPKEGDVMGPLDIENPVFAPTTLEIQTVRSLRAEANQILSKATLGDTK